MIQSVSFTIAAFEIRLSSRQMPKLLSRHIWFLVSASAKKKAKAIKFLGILKKYVSKNEIYFCLKKNSNVSHNKKVVFVFHTIFSWFHNADRLLRYPQMSVFSFHTFLFSYISF